MSLAAGTRLGVYEITAPLGAGGMGEVYRARDSKLNRDVAIKVLPDVFAADEERLARFAREAQTLAALNHPNIAAIYGVEESHDVRALVMELVAGEDLSTLMARGPVPTAEALTIARQIAEALEAAHELGIVHRDLKPANVMVRDDGTVKVLDFGLAKALSPVGASATADAMNSPTITTPAMTRAGLVLGTAAYMAPEQARGKAVDKRADIWAFGVVLYEMLTGARLFDGESVAETLGLIFAREPDLTKLPPSTPASIRDVIARCLVKDPRKRQRDIGDARLQIDDALAGRGEPPRAAGRPISTISRLASLVPWLVSAALAVTALGLWASRSEKGSSGTPLRRFTIDLPFQSVPNWTDFDAALSPRGTHLAYYGRRDNDVDAYVRPLDGLEGVALAEAREADAMAFSPDGEWLALRDLHGLRKVSIHGGRAQDLARIEDTGNRLGMSWGQDGNILVGSASGLLRVSSAGGPAVALTRVNAAAGETGHIEPFHLPGGTHALMTIERGRQTQLAIVDLQRATYQALPLSGARPAYSTSGHIVFRQGASVLAARFDLESRAVVGEAVPVLEGVRRGPYLAADGTMLYIPERGDSSARLVWVDRAGRPTPIAGERLDYSHLDLGAVGKQALLNIGREVYVRDIEQGTRRLLSSDDAEFPIWSADSRWATYSAVIGGKRGMFRQPADGSAAAERLPAGEGLLVPSSWNSRTGDLAFFDSASDIWILPPDGSARRFLGAPFNERSGRFSPDGRWLAYVSDETGSYQVYVVPYPGPGPKVAVSIDGGLSPLWSSDGRELFFRRGSKLLASAMTFTPALAATRPVELFDGPYTLDLMGHQRDDVAPDGRFLLVENSDDFRIVLVQNWVEELKAKVPLQ